MGDITAMPPGFRFYPTEEELVSFYLARKLDGSAAQTDHLNWTIHRVIPELDIYQFNPWDLPDIVVSLLPQQDMEWFFFVPRQESEARGGRPRRLAESGYWKATGSPGNVFSSLTNRPIGEKRTMVFYLGRAPAGRKTEWKMNEYKAFHGDPPLLRQEFSLCRVYKKSKFVRSFDRRPLAMPGVSLPQPQDNPGATTSALAQSSQTGTTTKGHVQNLSQIEEGSNSRSMDVEDEISFDLEDFFRAMK